MEKYIRETIENLCNECVAIPTSTIKFEKYVRDACKANYCGRYNKTWLCPPAVGEIEDLAKEYAKLPNAFVFSTVHEIEDSFDIEGMFDARKDHDKVEKLIESTVLENGGKLLGAGSCELCEKCTYPDAPCIFPKLAKPSVEACGIDVVTLCKDTNMKYVNGVNTVTYFSIIFYN